VKGRRNRDSKGGKDNAETRRTQRFAEKKRKADSLLGLENGYHAGATIGGQRLEEVNWKR